MRNRIIIKNNTYSFILFYFIALSFSSAILYIFHLKASLLYYPMVIYLIYSFIKKFSIRKDLLLTILFLIFLLLFFGSIANVHIYTIRYAFLPIVIYIVYVYVYKQNHIVHRVIKWLSIFSIIAVTLSIFSFIYTYLGGESYFSFPNPDGRINHLYLFSFANTINYNIMRPSFIYDEPGALSFFIVIVVLLREIYSFDKKITIFILIGGLVTLSLTHIMMTFLYLFFRSKAKYTITVIAIIGLILFSLKDVPAMGFFFDRFKVNESGKLQGDNRSKQIKNFSRIIDLDILILGNYKCDDKINKRCTNHGDISSSPVTPLYRGGISILVIQLITYFSLFILIFKNKKLIYPSVSLILLISQRPYFGEIGYQFMIYIVIISMFYIKNKGKK